MIFLLLKNRRVPVQLLLSLQQSQGLQCYNCIREHKSNDTCNKIETCEPDQTSCKILAFDDGQPIERYCERYAEEFLKCMVDLGYAKAGSSCGQVRKSKDEHYPQDLAECVPDDSSGPARSSSKKGQKDDAKIGTTACVCNTDLCNTVENIKLLNMPTTTATPSLPQNSQPQLTSSKILILTILTSVAFSNYI